jgi:uroporphyrinogen-III synthase
LWFVLLLSERVNHKGHEGTRRNQTAPASKKSKVKSNLPVRSLSGLRILVGRARHQAGALSSELRKRGAQVIEVPFIEIRRPRSYASLERALRALADYDWLILTSVNGVDALWARCKKLGVTRKDFAHLKLAAIGPATKKAIERLGLKVHVMPKEYVAEAVVQSLRRQIKGKRVLLARAKVARDVIPRELRKLGAEVNVVEAYETVVPKKSQTRLRRLMKDPKQRPHVVTFTSSSTVRNFVALLGKGSTRSVKGIRMVSIGPVTSATLRELGLRADIKATEFTIPGLVDAIARFFTHASRS